MNSRILIPGLALVLFGCSGWDRSNPLDPQNPDTGGKVTRVALSAIRHDVTVSWNSVPLSGISAYHVYRKRSGETVFQQIGTTGSDVSSFMDPDLPYDRPIQYAVTALTRSQYESPLSDSLSILLGPVTFWILDYYDGSVQRLTYDGRHRITFMRESIWPTAVAVDRARRQIWIVDWVTGYLYRMNESGQIDLWISGLDNPTLVACEPIRPEIWVVHADRSQIVRMNESGEVVGVHDGFETITGLCPSGIPDQFWVADQGLRKIQLLDRNGSVIESYGLSHDTPPVIDSHPEEGWVLVADSLNVMRLYLSGQVDSVTTLDLTCYDISVDRETGGCWMVLNGPYCGDEVVYLSRDGDITVRSAGYCSALAVAAVPNQSGCIVADTDRGRVVRLKPDGEILGELKGLVSPWDVIVY